MIVVADASPLIFLGKIRRLDVLRATVGGDVLVPESVHKEVLPQAIDPAEAEYLAAFLRSCTVEVVRQPRRFASAMSEADNDALTLAVRRQAVLLLCDDRITRLAAEAEGIRPLGTLGIFLRAVRREVLTPVEARDLIDRLVRLHGFRIGVELYRATMAEIGA